MRGKVAGDILEIKFERERGVWVYQFDVLTPKGRYEQIFVDAKTKRILKRKRRYR